MKEQENPLAFLLSLNLELAALESNGNPGTPPGLPAGMPEVEQFISADCINPR